MGRAGHAGFQKLQKELRRTAAMNNTAVANATAAKLARLSLPSIIQPDCQNLYDYMELFDISEGRVGLHQPFVVPERVMAAFVSQRGLRIANLMQQSHIDGLELLTPTEYTRRQRGFDYARIPHLPNTVRIYLLYPEKFTMACSSTVTKPGPSSSTSITAPRPPSALLAPPITAAAAFTTQPHKRVVNELSKRAAVQQLNAFWPTPPAVAAAAVAAATGQAKVLTNGTPFVFDEESDPITPLTGGNPLILDCAIKFMEEILRHYFPMYYFKLTPYGSMISGTALSTSFLNINVEMLQPDLDNLKNRDVNPYLADMFAPYCVDAVFPLLIRDFKITKYTLEEATGFARFAVGGLNIEYSFNKEIVTRSTKLIAEYMKLDDRVKPFMATLKLFCKRRNLLAPGISKGLRFYGYMIMAIAYFTTLEPPVLPNLQNINCKDVNDKCMSDTCASKHKFWDTIVYSNQEMGIAARYHDCISHRPDLSTTRTRVKKAATGLYWNSENTATVRKLFIDFLYYYGYDFDYKKYAVSLTSLSGAALRKKEFAKNAVVIEDPFCPALNVATVTELRKITSTFRGAFNLLYTGAQLKDLDPKAIKLNQQIPKKGGDKSLYSPYLRLEMTPTRRTLLLTGLPDLPMEENVKDADKYGSAMVSTVPQEFVDRYCMELVQLFTKFGVVENLSSYDGNTMRLTLAANHNSKLRDIVMPTRFNFRGQVAHIIELYESL